MQGQTFQDIILALSRYWADQGCVVLQPYDTEVGAGTFHPATTLRTLSPEPWRTAYVQPSRRPTDGRYGENPNRLQHYYQYQVILQPSPDNVLDLYFDSLRAIGIEPAEHDVRTPCPGFGGKFTLPISLHTNLPIRGRQILIGKCAARQIHPDFMKR